jgi:hypothetical protein
MRIAFTALAATALMFSTAQADGPARGVVELFTSQGCSSCPPADAALARILGDGRVVALAWHVDYWDYLGWKDTFSSSSATSRQAAYAQNIGGGSYTPEFVVNGSHGSTGSASVGGGLPVSVSVQGGKVTVGAGNGSGNLYLVSYIGSATVPISRGENTGKKITYRHVVTGMRKLASWSGKPLVVATGGGGSCAVILQRGGQRDIIGAANC